MECPKCKKDVSVLVTKDPRRRVRERRGLLLWIIGFPFFIIRAIWRILFGRKQKYHKKTYWHCNYCNNEWEQEF